MTLADELKQAFLFESLSDEQRQELAEAGSLVHAEAGEILFHEGEPADFLWMLLDGEWEGSRYVGGQKIVVLTTDRKGIYAGGFRAYGEGRGAGYRLTARALRASTLFRLPADELARLLWKWFPMGKHLLDGLFQTVERIDSLVRERESLVALGTMAAGLAHELNNPAAAAVRAGDDLRSTLRSMQETLPDLAVGTLSPDQLRAIFALQEQVAGLARDVSPLDALSAADREDEVADWLQGRGLDDAWKLAPVLVAGGVDLDWLEQAAGVLGPEALAPALRWIVCGLTASHLLDQLRESTRRISGLVRAVKEYTYMDRAPVQEIDVRDGIENTLVMLGHKLNEGTTVVREFDPELPRIEAYGSELNQVWLNLIDNAVDATNGDGEIRIRTTSDADGVLIEIADSGPGVPEDIRRRVFEPFFTTKEPGKGTGLGLDIARRIVVERHGGGLTLESEPGNTRFTVHLPLRLPRTGP
jgi:signal transduction histidine kinase